MMTSGWNILVNQIYAAASQIHETARLFWNGLIAQLSLLSVVDLVLVALLLWWLYRKLRQTELITVTPKIFLLLILTLIARVLGLWAFFYLSGALLLITLLAIGALYAPEIKHILSSDIKLSPHPRALLSHITTADSQTSIKTIIEAMAVLTHSRQPALFIIKRDKPLTRLVENSTKMNSPLKVELLIDFFANGSELSKGAALIDGNKVIGAGSTLFRPYARALFNPANPMVQRAAKELNAVAIITSKTTGDISVVCGDHIYKHLALPDLSQLLQNILVYRRI